MTIDISALLKSVTLALCMALAAASGALAQDDAPSPLAAHMAHMTEGSGQWRTPNPDYSPGDEFRPMEYGLNWAWGENGQHLIGELTGIYEDGRIAKYQSLYALYNPVTERVIIQQIGWDGTLMTGDAPVRFAALSPGQSETVDMIAHDPKGKAKIIRHVVRIVSPDEHSIDLIERDEDGAWQVIDTSVWKLET